MGELAIDGIKRTLDVESVVKRFERIRALILVITIFASTGVFGCAERRGRDSEQVQDMSQKTIEQVQEEYTDEWMAIDGVEGTAIGLYEGKPCIKIFSSVPATQLKNKIPSSVEGHPVIIEETGSFRALEQ